MKSAKRRRRNARASAKARESLAVYITVSCLRETYPVSADKAKSRMMVLPWRQCTYVGITDFASSFCAFVLCQSSSHGRVGTLMDLSTPCTTFDEHLRRLFTVAQPSQPQQSRISPKRPSASCPGSADYVRVCTTKCDQDPSFGFQTVPQTWYKVALGNASKRNACAHPIKCQSSHLASTRTEP